MNKINYFACRDTQSMPHELNISDKNSINEVYFIKNRPIVIIIHGYTGHRDFEPNSDLRPGMCNNYEIIFKEFLFS